MTFKSAGVPEFDSVVSAAADKYDSVCLTKIIVEAVANLHRDVSGAVKAAFGVKPDLFVHKNVRICRSCFTVKDGDLLFVERTGWKLLLLLRSGSPRRVCY